MAADDFKIIKLEQDVLNLERQVQDLSRQIAQLQQRSVGSTAQRAAPAERPVGPAGSPSWLSAANWSRVRTGMVRIRSDRHSRAALVPARRA
jgi:hypothetical protein